MTDETVRPAVAGRPAASRMIALDRAEAWHLLGTVGLGRIVFTLHALPAVRPVNHIVDGDALVIRTHEASALDATTRQASGPGAVVAFEADEIDPVHRSGWSVVVTGYARPVTDPRELARYRELLLPWVEQETELAVRITPQEVTGYRLTPRHPPRPLGDPHREVGEP